MGIFGSRGRSRAGSGRRVGLIRCTYRLYTPSLYLAGFRRQGGEAAMPVGGINGSREMRTLEHVAEVSPRPVRFVVSRKDLATGLGEISQRRPELGIELVVLPESQIPTPPRLSPPPGGKKR